MSLFPYRASTTAAGLFALAVVSPASAQVAPTAPPYAPVVTKPKATAPKPPAAQVQTAPPAAQPAPVSAAPAATAPVTTGSLPTPVFQTADQLQKAGVRRCLQTVQAVGQAAVNSGSNYAAVSTWNNKQPDNRFSVSMIGQQFAPGQNSTANGLAGVFSVPTAEGKCDAAAVQIIPTTEPCTTVQAQILAKGRSLGDLAGVPLLQNAANAQVMLLPAASNSCVLVVLSTVYTE